MGRMYACIWQMGLADGLFGKGSNGPPFADITYPFVVAKKSEYIEKSEKFDGGSEKARAITNGLGVGRPQT